MGCRHSTRHRKLQKQRERSRERGRYTNTYMQRGDRRCCCSPHKSCMPLSSPPQNGLCRLAAAGLNLGTAVFTTANSDRVRGEKTLSIAIRAHTHTHTQAHTGTHRHTQVHTQVHTHRHRHTRARCLFTTRWHLPLWCHLQLQWPCQPWPPSLLALHLALSHPTAQSAAWPPVHPAFHKPSSRPSLPSCLLSVALPTAFRLWQIDRVRPVCVADMARAHAQG